MTNNNQVTTTAYAEGGLYGRRLVNSCFMLSVETGPSVADMSRNAAVKLWVRGHASPGPGLRG